MKSFITLSGSKSRRNVVRILAVVLLVAAAWSAPTALSPTSQAQAHHGGGGGGNVAIWVVPLYVSADGHNYQYYQQFFVESCPTTGRIFSDGGYMNVARALSARGYWTAPGNMTFWRYGRR